MIKPSSKGTIPRNFLYILLVSTLLLLGLMLLFNAIIQSKNKNLLNQRLKENKKTIEQIFASNTATQKNYIFDNSYWDGLVDYYKTHDSSWIYDNFLAGLSKYNINYIWFLDKEFKAIKTYSVKLQNSIADDSISDNKQLLDKLVKDPFAHFFIKNSGELIEIYTAPVQPSIDVNRKTTPIGYAIIGVSVDSSYMQSLSERSDQTIFTLVDESKEDKTDVKIGKITTYKSLNDVNNYHLKFVKIEKHYPDLVLFQSDVFKYSTLFLLSTIAILFLLYLLAVNKIYKPLDQLSKSLNTNSKAPIKNLSTKANEFGALARLVTNSFDHKQELLNEIDIRKQSEYQLQEAMYKVETTTVQKIKAEESAAAKTDFLSTISHEIRTPINGVIGIINLLQDEDLNKRQKEYVNVLDFSAKHLLALVSDVLDFSKIETGKMEFEKNSFDVQHVCNNVYKLFKPRADEKGIELKVIPSAESSNSLHGDNVRLSQVLTNLLGNAIKFTNTGYVHFGFKIISSTDTHMTYEFFVKDSGIGIDVEQQDKIFESFSQANVKINREYGGTGLGLTISKKLIEKQGGSIALISRKNVGSTFTFVLTYEKHAFVASLPIPERKNALHQDLQGLKVLVAEDNKINTFVLQKFLTKWNVDANFCVTGLEALRMVQENNFDLILMDLQMPEMDGQQATFAIRALPETPVNKIPIIALTADASVSTQELLLTNGFNHFITKPFNPDALFRILKKYYNLNK